jgi:hypothetical protein
MTSKQRIAQAERIAHKAKDTKRMTWKEFINADIETIDAHAKANGGMTWADFIAKAEDKPTAKP